MRKPMYSLHTVITQIGAVPSPIGFSLSPGVGQAFEIDLITMLAGTFGAGRALQVYHNPNGSTLTPATLLSDTLTTAQTLKGLQQAVIDSTATANTVSAIGANLPYTVVGADTLAFEGTSLADTEIITILVRLKLLGNRIPTKATIGTATSPTYSGERIY